MASDRPDPGEFFEMAQRMLRDLFGGMRSEDEPWAEATRGPRERTESQRADRVPSSQRQRENLTFALGTRAVEALEDLALNVAAIRQRLERMDPQDSRERPEGSVARPEGSQSRPEESQPRAEGSQPRAEGSQPRPEGSQARPGDEEPGQSGSDAAGR